MPSTATYYRQAGLIILSLLVLLTGCSTAKKDTITNDPNVNPDPVVQRYEGEKSQEIPYVYTGRRELSLTFNGMGDRETMDRLLDELDKYKIKATFFLPGMRVAEEPDIAQAIVDRGHEIENNLLNQLDITDMNYNDIYQEVKLANEVIKEHTGAEPVYVRTKSGDISDDLALAAAHLGMKAVVSYSINPKDRDMKSAEEIGEYVERYIHRGGIITLNTDINPEIVESIKYIAAAAEDIGYKLIPLRELAENGGVRKPLEEIPGYDAAKINPDYENAEYELIYKVKTDKKQVALTLDDWATDKTVTQFLDILAEKKVHATFFLRARGVVDNPNLARAIIEEGHDVANHTYTHPVVTSLTAEELQEEIVKGHEVLTEAIQQQPLMLFRPPTGAIDAQSAQVIAATGYEHIAMYDVTAMDWDVSHSADDIVNMVMDQTENGSIILLHILDGIHSVEALPRIIDQLRAKGYTFVSLVDLMEQNKTWINSDEVK